MPKPQDNDGYSPTLLKLADRADNGTQRRGCGPKLLAWLKVGRTTGSPHRFVSKIAEARKGVLGEASRGTVLGGSRTAGTALKGSKRAHLAEGMGFEPMTPITRSTRLAGGRTQPLCDPSAGHRYCSTSARRCRGAQLCAPTADEPDVGEGLQTLAQNHRRGLQTPTYICLSA